MIIDTNRFTFFRFDFLTIKRVRSNDVANILDLTVVRDHSGPRFFIQNLQSLS